MYCAPVAYSALGDRGLQTTSAITSYRGQCTARDIVLNSTGSGINELDSADLSGSSASITARQLVLSGDAQRAIVMINNAKLVIRQAGVLTIADRCC